MAEYEEIYEENGEEKNHHNSHAHTDFSPPPNTDLTESKSHYGSRDYDRESSRGREREQEKGREKERKRDKGRDRDKERSGDRERSRDMDRERSRDKERSRDRYREGSRDREQDQDGENERDRDRDRHHRDRHRDHSERREKGRDRDDDDYYRIRDYDRRRDYDREDRHRRRSRSRSTSVSRRRSEHRSRSRSRSRSKSKRTSGFDMAPPASALLAGASAVTGQMMATNAAIPGVFQNMFPLATSQPFSALPVMPVQAMTQQATRHARRVYVGGLSPTANEQSVATFFSQVMANIGGNTAGPGDAVVNVYINHDKKFAFVEMRSVEEASNAMALDGIIFEGAPVKVRRPTDYNPSLAATLGPSQPNPNLNLGAVGLTPGSAGGLDGPDRIFVGGLPYYFTETQIRELLETFGPLRGFDLVKDRETGNSKGYAFCVYQDLAVTDIACAALNGIKMGDKTLTVRRANQGSSLVQPKPEQESILMHAQQQIALQKLMLQPALVATKVVCLTHAVAADELKDDEDYEEILDDMRQECSKFGTLVNVVIPRPRPDGEVAPGVGKVFLEYVDVDGATKARVGLNGRKFGGNQVIAVFYPENKFSQGDYEG
ncbi:PREDICTED: splicing factor U2af large subunit A-like isoform X2 [Lupinus angustifolius]|uniref:splicing factor U2af large subunit A-like isoform X2 n=1 Tax=Lupinus angustifolius TaxID=3871 RepID=UPI00092F3A60|nr:PREDICTED: splicing factor U2af large subunit A-like isoform X2 [Lupinus angustifolius]